MTDIKNKKLIVLCLAGVGQNIINRYHPSFLKEFYSSNNGTPITPIFPALTIPVQAAVSTGKTPQESGVYGNGFYFDNLKKITFWEQASSLVDEKRIWDILKSKQNIKTSITFWQNSLGSNNDIIISPAPIHKHHGGMIMDCYSKPTGYYKTLKSNIGDFPLQNYWGPFASAKSSLWIENAIYEIIKDFTPNLLLSYLPIMDYSQQKLGTNHKKVHSDLLILDKILSRIYNFSNQYNYKLLIYSDYPITEVNTPLYINRILKKHDLFKVRNVENMEYPDLYESNAFAIADHQIANVYIREKNKVENVINILKEELGDNIYDIIYNQQQNNLSTPTLTLVSSTKSWFSYKWWATSKSAPDFASHVDIHNKPGYDPCELFSSINPFKISLDDNKVKGSHGSTESKEEKAIFAVNTKYSSKVETHPDIFQVILEFFT